MPSFSLSPDRPDPTRKQNDWYKFWQEELAFVYSEKQPVLVNDTDHFKWLGTVSEENLENLKQKREQTASFRQQIAVISLTALTRKDPILEKWNAMTRKKKDSTVVEVLVFLATTQGTEDDYQYAPEINTKYLCADDGGHLAALLDHFQVRDPSELPGLDCPNYKNEAVWRMYDIKELREGIPRPEGVRGIQNTILVRRNYFLSLFLVQLLVNLYKLPTSISYQNPPKLAASIEQSALLATRRAIDPFSPSTYTAIESAASKAKKTRLVDVCEQCLSPPKPATKLLVCGRCRGIGRTVFYCSRECQTTAYPPHKQVCGVTLRSLDLSLASSADEDDDTPIISSTKASLSLPLYTTSPTPALLLQLLFLKKDEESDYNFIFSTPTGPGRYPLLIPTTSLRTLFLEARAKALGEGDRVSIGVMDLILRSAEVLPRGTGVDGITTQLEGEFEVDMMICRRETLEKEGVFEGVRTALNLND